MIQLCLSFGGTDYSDRSLRQSPPQFDPKEEARLRRKIDLMIVPIVSLLYLFCFIDRANIGKYQPLSWKLIRFG
jgi:hypothetical protein